MADTVWADYFQNLIQEQQSFTSWHERNVQSIIREFQSLREHDVEAIREILGWPAQRDYVLDPIPEKISGAFADLLFSEEPVVTSAQKFLLQQQKSAVLNSTQKEPVPGEGVSDTTSAGEPDEDSMLGPDQNAPPETDTATEPITSDQDRLDSIVEANEMASELWQAENVCSSEGEVWYRIYVDRGQSDYPIVEWHSRSHVRPLFHGRKLAACAFVSEIHREQVGDEWEVWRYLQIHTDGLVRNLLYRGSAEYLGVLVPLADRPETSELEDDWEHELGMLAGRVPNRLGKDRRLGISDYKGSRELIYSLNEATTIGHENARLTLKRRVVVPRTAINMDGQFDASEDVLIADGDDLDMELGNSKTNSKFTVLEYSFDATSLIAYKADLAAIILTRSGIAEQFVSSSTMRTEGLAQSGTALRLRLIPTTLAAKGKIKFWNDVLPKILMLTQLVDSLDDARGGFGRDWTMPGEPPVVKFGSALPEDLQEEVNRHVLQVNAELESRLTAIKRINPEYSDDDALRELNQIDWEIKNLGVLANATAPSAPASPVASGQRPTGGKPRNTGGGLNPGGSPAGQGAKAGEKGQSIV